MAQLDALLKYLKDHNGSDLHLAAGVVPRIRRRGSLEPIPNQAVLEDDRLGYLMREIAPASTWTTYVNTSDADFAYQLPGVARFRVNYFRQENGRGAVFRTIPEKIIPIEDLKLPPVINSFAHMRDGLVLVTGPTGSGKSTTLASIIDLINRTYARHIVTIEDPIEFVHANKKSVFSHREIGRHTNGFGPALRAAIRQDADVLLVGEMRDYETISLAFAAAEMGLLVFGTLHTNSASKTIDRLIDAFPANQQAIARMSLSESLTGVVSQLLIPTADGKGRVAATEILVRTPGLGNLIRENNTAMIFSTIQSGKAQGMQTMDMALQQLVQSGQISQSAAYLRAMDKTLFERGNAPVVTAQKPAQPGIAPGLAVTQAPGGGVMVTAKPGVKK